MVYMIAAYGVIWLITFAFVATIFWRQRQLQQQVAWMEQLLEMETETAGPEDATPSAPHS